MAKKRKQQPVTGPFQEPLPGMLPHSSWEAPRMSELPQSWRDAKRVSFDIETCDPNLRELGPGNKRDGFMVGYSFAIEDGPSHYVPIRHEGGDNVESSSQALAYLRDRFAEFQGVITGANLPYDLGYAIEEGAELHPGAEIRDVQVAEPIIWEHWPSYSLDAIASYYKLPPKDERLLRAAASVCMVDPKSGLWRLPARYVGEYAEQDARLPLQILRRQERVIDDQDLWGIFKLECKLTRVIVASRQRGLRVDTAKLDRLDKWSLDEQAQAFREVRRRTGVKLAMSDVTKPSALAKALIAVGIDVPITAQAKRYSVKGEWLEQIDHPVAGAILWAKQMNHLRSYFVGSVRKHLVGDRLHCSFHQLRRTKDDHSGKSIGQIGGRISITNPTLQNQPIRNELYGPAWREIYIPEDGEFFCVGDYSQQEPRAMVHYADKIGLPRADEAAARYREDPDTDFHQMAADFSGLPRKIAKNMLLGLTYNMGGAKLCQKYLHTPTKVIEVRGKRIRVAGDEGQKVIDAFNHSLPFIKALSKKVSDKARRVGFVRTELGRVLRFKRDAEGNYDFVHQALSRLIQGFAADQTKKAMVDAYEAGFVPQLQVHDELDQSMGSLKEAERYREVMKGAHLMRVPSKVDLEVGPSWGEAVKVEGLRAVSRAVYDMGRCV